MCNERCTHGACDYLIKPVRLEALKNIWQHVVRKKKHVWKDIEQSGSVEMGNCSNRRLTMLITCLHSSANEGSWRNSKRRKDEKEDAEDRDDDTSLLKEPRVVWSVELHQQFVAAANQLEIDRKDGWRKRHLHSHVYRVPEPFRNEVVVVVGMANSGQDIAMELVEMAKEVHLSAKSVDICEGLSKVISQHDNLHLHLEIHSLHEDGRVVFVDGSCIVADTIIYCTG